MLCNFLGPVKQNCSLCGHIMASYFCAVCKLLASQKKIEHCAKCRICRVIDDKEVGNFHCDLCNACFGLSDTDHICKGLQTASYVFVLIEFTENVHDDSIVCPFCQCSLKESPYSTSFPCDNCYNGVHDKCYEQYEQLKKANKQEIRCVYCNNIL
jgi:hypothetical protein